MGVVKTGKSTGKSQRVIESNIERGKTRGKTEAQATGVALRKARTAKSQREKGRAEG